MKKTGYWKGFTSALVLMGLGDGPGVTATAASKRTIEVEDGIKITINDAKFTPMGRRRATRCRCSCTTAPPTCPCGPCARRRAWTCPLIPPPAPWS